MSDHGDLDDLYDGDEDFGTKSPTVPRRLKEKPAPKSRRNRLPAFSRSDRRIPIHFFEEFDDELEDEVPLDDEEEEEDSIDKDDDD